mmetsp:Transcript_39837/g.107627  ORF Transcript_39837/g.107627 Transcript_39837/m.107627 type:complete len:362 (+) Transcript_39837:255-1340(+)
MVSSTRDATRSLSTVLPLSMPVKGCGMVEDWKKMACMRGEHTTMAGGMLPSSCHAKRATAVCCWVKRPLNIRLMGAAKRSMSLQLWRANFICTPTVWVCTDEADSSLGASPSLWRSKTSSDCSAKSGVLPTWLDTAMPMIRRPWQHFETRHSASISLPAFPGMRKATTTLGEGAPKGWLSAFSAAWKSRAWCSSLMQRSVSLTPSAELSPKYVAMRLVEAGSSSKYQLSLISMVASWDESTSCTVPLIRAMARMTRDTRMAEKVTLFVTTSQTVNNRTCSCHGLIKSHHLRMTASGKPDHTRNMACRSRSPTTCMSLRNRSLKASLKNSTKHQVLAQNPNHCILGSVIKYIMTPKTCIMKV